MYLLSDEQIDFILNDIRARGVETESLQQDLLDHVCCIVEQELEENGDFEQFYHTVIRRFYRRELREIEEERALLLTFKNYYAMRKVMIVSGLLTAVTLMVAAVFKIMHWPGAAILLVLGIVQVSLIFLPLLLIFKLREVSAARDKAIFALGTIAGSAYFLSMLFKIMHWPGANIMWVCTLLFSFFVFLPLYFFTGIRKEETRMNTLVSTILLLSVIGTQFALTRIHPPGLEQKNVVVTTVTQPSN